MIHNGGWLSKTHGCLLAKAFLVGDTKRGRWCSIQ